MIITTESEFALILVSNGEPNLASVLNRSATQLKLEQLDNFKKSNFLLGETPDVWDISTEYYIGDSVYFNGKYYEAIQDDLGNDPSNDTIWKNRPVTLRADEISYNKYLSSGTIWDSVDSNQILSTYTPTELFSAVELLDIHKANENGNNQKIFLVSDDTADMSAATSKQWVSDLLSQKANKLGNSSQTFLVDEPNTLSHATTKNYVDNLDIATNSRFLDYALKNGNSSNRFKVNTPNDLDDACTKDYVDIKVNNALSEGNNNLIKKVDLIITPSTINVTDIGVPLTSGELIVYVNGSILKEGTDFTVGVTELNWTVTKTDGDALLVLFVDNAGMTATLDGIYARQDGADFTSSVTSTEQPSNPEDLTRMDYVDTSVADLKSYTNTKFETELNKNIKPGDIIMTTGDSASITARAPYWYLCDGTNGTPDLSGRFIIGTGTNGSQTYTDGQIGGEAEHEMTVAELPSHNHIHLGTKVTAPSDRSGVNNVYIDIPHNDSLDGDGNIIDSVGETQPMNNLPPYYALAFIMRSNTL